MGPTEWTAIMGAGVTLVGFGVSWGVLRTIIKNHSGQLSTTTANALTMETKFIACQLRSAGTGAQLNEALTNLTNGMAEYKKERNTLSRDLQLHREEVIGRLATLEALIRNGGQ